MWKEASASVAQSPRFDFLLHLLDAFLHEPKILFHGPGSRHGRSVALQSHADLKKVGNGGVLAFHHSGQNAFLLGFRRSDKGSLTLPLVQQTHDHQLVDGISHRGAADAKSLGQFPLGEDFFSGFEFTAENQFPQLVKHLVGYALGFDGLEFVGHDRITAPVWICRNRCRMNVSRQRVASQ